MISRVGGRVSQRASPLPHQPTTTKPTTTTRESRNAPLTCPKPPRPSTRKSTKSSSLTGRLERKANCWYFLKSGEARNGCGVYGFGVLMGVCVGGGGLVAVKGMD